MNRPIPYRHDTYHTPPGSVPQLNGCFPSIALYRRFLPLVIRAGIQARLGQYGDNDWIQDSIRVLGMLEQIGVQFHITGMNVLSRIETPCVIIGNHMSTLETAILPGIIQSRRPVTFVVKESLLNYPVFGHVLRSREAIPVTRKHPKEDFKRVLELGMERLSRGISIIVFPQTTRVQVFDPAGFNSIGVKLAQRADVPAVPLALWTDAWAQGALIPDLGPIDPGRPVYFSFGDPIRVPSKSTLAHQEVLDFIQSRLSEWNPSGNPKPEISDHAIGKTLLAREPGGR